MGPFFCLSAQPGGDGGGQKIFLLVPSFQNMYRLFAQIRIELALNRFQKHLLSGLKGFPARKETVVHIQPNGQFLTVFGQNGQNGENYQKSAWNIFLALTSPN